MQKLTLGDVLKNETLIGGNISFTEDNVVYRGPLARIRIHGNGVHGDGVHGDVIIFSFPWLAQFNPETREWKVSSKVIPLRVKKSTFTPQDMGDGMISFEIPFLGTCTIYPRHGNKLHPRNVKGLPKDSERLLALYPDLPFNRDIAMSVLTGQSWPRQAEGLKTLPTGATLRDLLGLFRHDSSAEEFLWHYIEAVTGEEGVHRKVY